MDKEILTKIGFPKNESIIYITLLKLGFATVREISKDSGFHRTNIYDILEKLKEKGLVVTQKQGKTTRYKTSDTKNLYNFLEERQTTLDKLMPGLNELRNQINEEIEVEIYKGKEGMKSIYRDILRTRKTIYAYDVSVPLRTSLPNFSKEFIREQKKLKIDYYGIYTNEANIPEGYKNIRVTSKEFLSPVITTIYGNKVLINIWEPSLIGILIKSEIVAKTYLKKFKLLWDNAKEINKK